MRRLKMEILELIASTATLHRQVRRSFRAELAVKRRFCSVMPQAFSVSTRARGHFVRYATFYGLGRPEDRLPGGLDLDFLAAPKQCARFWPMAWRRSSVPAGSGWCRWDRMPAPASGTASATPTSW